MERTGTILRGPALEPISGRLVIGEDGRIEAIEPEPVESEDIILPAFINAHTHVGDSIAKEAGGGLSLEALVAPPDGLKHRLLRAASREELVGAIEQTLSFMERAGTAACYDFREGDVEGVEHLREAAAGRAIDAYAFARGSVAAMEAGDGFGASGANDGEFAEERAATRAAGKPFFIHAGEGDATDLQPALDLEPDALIHVVHPDETHLERIATAGVPVVVCPRSNLVTGVGLPPFEALAERTTLALGTDNVMLNAPSMFREMAFCAKLSDLPATTILQMATVNGSAMLDLEYGVLEPGRVGRVLVLDGESPNLAGVRDPVRAVVRRAGVDDVKEVIVAD